jgi:AraC family transcriptional regulator
MKSPSANKIKESSLKEYKKRIAKVLDYIQKNITGDLSLEVLSEVSCFSKYHFLRVFYSILGETPNDFVNRVRIERAALLLIVKNNLPITDIALELGFSSSSAFARAFKERFNCSASEWRESGYNGFAKKNSNICKENSNIGKDSLSGEEYFTSVDNLFLKQDLRSIEMNVEIKQLPKQHIAYVISYAGYNNSISNAFETICKWAGPRRLINQDTLFIGISLDDPDITPADKCRYYACINVSENTKVEGEIHSMVLPEGEYAVLHFDGKEEGIKTTYKYLYGEWLPQSGYVPGESPCYEIYRNDPDKDKKFVFDLCLPVKPLS